MGVEDCVGVGNGEGEGDAVTTGEAVGELLCWVGVEAIVGVEFMVGVGVGVVFVFPENVPAWLSSLMWQLL